MIPLKFHGLCEVLFLGWFLYTILFAYYSGAQTMFFFQELKIPVESMSEVIIDKNWNLVSGPYIMTILNLEVARGNQLYIDYMDRIEQGKEYNFQTQTVTITLINFKYTLS